MAVAMMLFYGHEEIISPPHVIWSHYHGAIRDEPSAQAQIERLRSLVAGTHVELHLVALA